MPYKTPELTIASPVFEWARKSAGYTADDIAHHLNISKEQVELWEKGSSEITIRAAQLQDLAHFVKRPLAAFLLSEPPEEIGPPKDFRRSSGKAGPLSPMLRLVIRRTRRLRRVAGEVMRDLDVEVASKIPSARLQDNPEHVGENLRRAWGITPKDQLEWKNPWMALRNWRQSIEARNILVFQGDFEREEAQGFSISDEHPYAIILSSGDHPNARSFTLFHELGHLLLHEGGVCITEYVIPGRSTKVKRTENWCNRFAESFLVDDDILRSMKETEEVIKMAAGYEDKLAKLSSRFKVSRPVILFKLWHTELISDLSFHKMYSHLQQTSKPRPKKKDLKERRGPSQAQVALRERGRLFSRIVLDGLDHNLLGYTDAADYLGMRTKYLDRLRSTT